jgi:poly-gamma-glutamate synthase PgsB/CapB
MIITLFLCFVVIGLLVFEKLWIDRNVKKIPIRIHVNGTRGKSTVVKYISELLRLNNYKTISKITGITPTLFRHDNHPQEIIRRGGARITEQFKIIHKAAASKSDALVLECMSINPELQQVESRAFSPQYYIITNIRQDHLEEMGESEENWVDSICSAIPRNCTILTAEKKHLDKIKTYAALKNSKVLSTKDIKINNGYHYGINEDNVKLAILFAEQQGISYSKFLYNLEAKSVDDNEINLKIEGKEVKFYNVFAINDVPSAESFLSDICKNEIVDKNFVIIFNSRADRPYRSLKFAELLADIKNCSKIIVTGNHAHRTIKELLMRGVEKRKISLQKFSNLSETIKGLKRIINESSTIIGIGNIKQQGLLIIDAMKQMSRS